MDDTMSSHPVDDFDAAKKWHSCIRAWGNSDVFGGKSTAGRSTPQVRCDILSVAIVSSRS